MIKKILKIVPYGDCKERPEYYFIFVCEVNIYSACKNMDMYTERYIVKDLNICEVGDTIKISTDCTCDFEDFLVVSIIEKY